MKRRNIGFCTFLILIFTNLSIAQTPIYSCQDITIPGNYIIMDNLYTSNNTCLNIHDVSNVSIFGNNHRIGTTSIAIQIIRAQNIQISAITLLGTHQWLLIHTGTNITIYNCIFGEPHIAGSYDGWVIIEDDSSKVLIKSNIVYGTLFSQYTMDSVIESNVFIGAATSQISIYLEYGKRNSILNNTLSMIISAFGDNGITLKDEQNDIISGNDISGPYNHGIELVGHIESCLIKDNIIHDLHPMIHSIGIASWYWLSWRNNKILNNIFYNINQIMLIQRTCGLRPAGHDPKHRFPADNFVYFQGNIINNILLPNSLYNTPPLDYDGHFCSVPNEIYIPNTAWILTDNAFWQNGCYTGDIFNYVIDNGKFVDWVYCTILRRQADINGYIYWKNILDQKWKTRLQVYYYFINSIEANATWNIINHSEFIIWTYRNVMLREPDVNGYNYWITQERKSLWIDMVTEIEFNQKWFGLF